MAAKTLLARLYSLNGFANTLQSPFALALRVYVGWVFLKSGWLKLQDWEQTVALFESEYKVPWISPLAAAYAGTAAEIVLPVLLILGVGGRLVPLGLFLVNLVAVISYGHWFFTDGGIAGLRQHQLWGLMLLVLTIYGVGKWALDEWANLSPSPCRRGKVGMGAS